MGWKVEATTFLWAYAKKNNEFTCTQAFRWAYEQGLPIAESPKQLGPVFKEALMKTGMVRIAGYVKSDDPNAKGRMVVSYHSVVCQYFDGENQIEMQLTAMVSSFKKREIDAITLARKAYELGVTSKE